MELKAKRRILMAINCEPKLPISLCKAACVSAMPFNEPSNGRPERRIMKAVQLQMTIVSVNTLSACIRPCFTGWDTVAVAAALGAEPMPASLENNPRRTPCMIVVPRPPPTNCSIPKALVNIWLISEGNREIWFTRIYRATSI